MIILAHILGIVALAVFAAAATGENPSRKRPPRAPSDTNRRLRVMQ